MFLTKLELTGFKSFAGKTLLEFPRGIVAIVGPNGSGKSNVIDAIRWLLGERDAKNLRGERSEDLIFAGTPTRARMGLAQARLHFDNRSKFFPVDYEEVSVVRQVTRDGTSQYFLNKAEVRLKDIVDFFAHSRLGTKGLIIIGQGQSDLFIRATPQERREMIEEVLGLREYQLKKNEAARKLAHATENANKVTALLAEITPHLRLLTRQTAKWEKREEVAAELAGLEQTYFSRKIWAVKRDLAALRPALAEAERAFREGIGELESAERKLKEARAAQLPDPKTLELFATEERELLARRRAAEKEAARFEAKLEYRSAREVTDGLHVGALISSLRSIREELRTALAGDLAVLRAAVRSTLQKIEAFFSGDLTRGGEGQAVRSAEDLTAPHEKLRVFDAELETLRAKREELILNSERVYALAGEMFSVFENKKDEIARLESEKNKLRFEEERLNERLLDIAHELTQVGRALSEFKEVEASQAIPPAGGASTNDQERTDIEKRMLRLRGELASIGDVDEALVREAQETGKRHAFLTAQLDDLTKAATDLTALMRDLEYKIHQEFTAALSSINVEFQKFFQLMFGGGKARLKLKLPEPKTALAEEGDEEQPRDALVASGMEIELSLPRRRILGLEMLSGGERSLVSIAALFALIAVSPPPFLVLDEIDAALDEQNSRRFAELVKSFSGKTQFVIVTHNRATMEVADALYGVTMAEDGASKVVSLKLET